MKSLIDVFRNVEGFIRDALLLRSMSETTSTHLTPDDRNVAIHTWIFKTNVHIYSKTHPKLSKRNRGSYTYKTLEVLGPEHEFSIVNERLQVLPIVDKILKDYHGRIVNSVELNKFTLGKELQTHVIEIKPNAPFTSPIDFEETMHEALTQLSESLKRKHNVQLLGTGMHPLLRLDETGVWPHRHRLVYQEYSKAFNLKQHGWLNIQSFQLNLPFTNEQEAVLLHNLTANLCPYLPAIAASSPIYESKLGESVDNRMRFYAANQKEVPSITKDVVPEYISSLQEYRERIINRYSTDLATLGIGRLLLGKDWVNSRGAIIRFDRKAIEIRIMDEQECIKSDVALSCFIRSVLRGFLAEGTELLPHKTLVKDFNSILKNGLEAETANPAGKTARQICQNLLSLASRHASKDEKRYIPIIQKRIERGNLSKIIRERVVLKAQRTTFFEAVVDIYSALMKNLINNQPYF